MLRLSSKNILIMGGGADGPPAAGETLAIGNGRAMAIQCAREGARVMVTDRNLSSARETAEAIVSEGGKAEAIACNVTSNTDVQRALEEALKAFGSIDGLVNNAAISDMTDVVNTTDDEFKSVMDVNVRGCFLAIKYALPIMAGAGGGSIVNISSLAAIRSAKAGSGIAYDCSKAALAGLMRHAAVSASAHNVRVNNLLPGIINSTILRRFVGDRDVDFSEMIPLRRMGTPWEIAKAATFLLSDDASYITGTELLVDGGASARL